jgi:diguanylate cyclase (GGDEF)-like protein
MRRHARKIPSTVRLSILTALLALFMAWLALGNAAQLPWDPRWYLAAHTTMEVFSVVIAMLVFSTGWHGIGRDVPIRVALLSPAALAIGLLDIGHLLTVPGMPLLDGPVTVARGIDFWLLARAIGAAALLVAAFAPRERTVSRRMRGWALLASLCIVALGFWQAVANPLVLPPTFVPGQGLTPFKIGCELVLIALNAVAALFLLRRALVTRLRTDRYLATTAAVMALSGVSFALYTRPGDVMHMVGHVYKVIAYLCMHRAIWVAAVQAPYLRLQRSERSLAESEASFRSLMECAPDAILLVGAEGRITMMNARAESLFGVARETAAGLPLDVLVPPAAGDAELDCRRLYGAAFPAEVRRAGMPSGQQVAIVRDLSERRRLERALVEQLTHDALTGLPNRNRILETLDEAIAGARQDGRTLAVLVFDLHEFRKINSGYGYGGGDDVLRECVVRLSSLLAGGDMLARQGGNEFIVVQKHSGEAAAAALAGQLLDSMREPFVLDGQRVFLSASVGIALLPAGACGAHELLQMAQVAMAAARAEGPARYRFHSDAMAQAIRERVDLEALLRHAIERNQFVLQYQPRVDLASGAVIGVEALVRWRHPVLGLVPPARFIPLAEETGLIDDLDLWVLDEACARAAAWRTQGLPPLRVSVNLSARQFQQAGLAQRVQAALERSSLAPHCLEIEITDSTVMRDTGEAASVLRSLKALGVALSIDDFGTGYSSLSYLKRFPIDVLKIDRSFVSDVTTDPNDAAIACAIIALAHTLNLEAVAEGVETAEQAAFLRDNGCDEIQGYYFSPPVWPEQIEQMFAATTANGLTVD